MRSEQEAAIWAEISGLQMEVNALTDAYIAQVRVEREEGERIRDSILARASGEYANFGTLQGYISVKAPEVAQRIAELEGDSGGLSSVEEELLRALKAPYVDAYERLPRDLPHYLGLIRETDSELQRAEFLSYQFPEQLRAEKLARIWELKSSIPVQPVGGGGGGQGTTGPRMIPAFPEDSRSTGRAGFQLAELTARMTALEERVQDSG